jgi:hypothetical protein
MSTKFDRCSHLVLKALETPFVSQEMAAHYAGVHKRTLQKWIAEGAEDSMNDIESDKSIFYHSLKKSQVVPAIDAVTGIKMAGDEGQWQALAWLLERLWPRIFGRNALELEKIAGLEKNIDQLEQLIVSKCQGGQGNGQGNEKTNTTETD